VLPLTLLIAVCVLTYSFEIVFGLGGTLLMLPVLGFWFDAKTLVIYSTLPQILVGTVGLARSEKTVALAFLVPMLAFAALGSGVGVVLFYCLPSFAFQMLLAITVTASGVYLLVARGRLRLNRLHARILDTLAGTSQALFGISGPIAMTRLLATFERKTVVRNYALAFFLALNLLRLLGYVINGTLSVQVERMMLVSTPFLVLALWFANQLHLHVNESVFRRVVAWLIIGAGISLFFHD
jgi:uncharacterized membrane protein YfcA